MIGKEETREEEGSDGGMRGGRGGRGEKVVEVTQVGRGSCYVKNGEESEVAFFEHFFAPKNLQFRLI